MGGWYLLVYSYSFNQLKIKILLIYLPTFQRVRPTDSADSADSTDSADSDLNPHLDSLGYF